MTIERDIVAGGGGVVGLDAPRTTDRRRREEQVLVLVGGKRYRDIGVADRHDGHEVIPPNHWLRTTVEERDVAGAQQADTGITNLRRAAAPPAVDGEVEAAHLKLAELSTRILRPKPRSEQARERQHHAPVDVSSLRTAPEQVFGLCRSGHGPKFHSL